MLNTDELRAKLQRQYPRVLSAWSKHEDLFPMRFAVGRLPDEFSSLREYIQKLKSDSNRYSYRVEFQKRNFRRWGEHDIPLAIYIDSIEIFLSFVDKKREFEYFQDDARLICTTLPILRSWVEQHPLQVIEYHGKWTLLLEVCQSLLENAQVDLFLRELPISQHTKFIEGHKRILRLLLDYIRPASIDVNQSDFALRYGFRTAEQLVRIRLLDNQLDHRYGLALDDLSIPISQLDKLDLHDQIGLIVENKTSFLTLPFLPNAFAIFGSGFDVTALKQVKWLTHCRLLYWGDLDSQGFEILALLRRNLQHVQSIMMDNQTFETFREFVVTGTPAVPIYYPELTNDEAILCQWLTDYNLRLEQERIQSAYVLQQILQIISK